jgi:6-phosphogluconolactonase
MMNKQPIFHQFDTKNDLHSTLTGHIVKMLNAGIAENGKASLVVSGGSTPKALFEKLSLTDLAWDKITVSLVDERWVDPQSSDSNEHLVKTHLLKNRAANASFIGLKTHDATAKAGVSQCLQNIKVLSEPFDVVILGMGDDGHTASFFPRAEALDEALSTKDACIAVTPPEAPYERMTLSRNRLLNTKALLLHIEGENKHRVYLEALKDGSVEAMPIRAMIHQDILPPEVYYTKGHA